MDPSTLQLLNLGFSLAGKLLDFVNKRGDESAQVPSAGFDEIGEYIERSSVAMQSTVKEALRVIIDKIEHDRLEELLSRTRNLATLVRMKRPDQALQYAMSLRESVDYAQNRLQEEKLNWLGPYLAGYSVYVAGLLYSGADASPEFELFREIVRQAQTDILDHTIPRMVGAGEKLPWPEIGSFLSGNTGALLPILLQWSEVHPLSPARSEVSTETAIDIKSIAEQALAGVDKVYFAPHIPQQKLRGAQHKLIPSADLGDALIAVIDITAFGGNKDGVVIFPSYFIYADIAEEPVRIAFRDITTRPALKGFKVTVNSKTMNFYSTELAAAFAAFLEQVATRNP